MNVSQFSNIIPSFYENSIPEQKVEPNISEEKSLAFSKIVAFLDTEVSLKRPFVPHTFFSPLGSHIPPYKFPSVLYRCPNVLFKLIIKCRASVKN